jgi:hypothetical protein
MYLCMYMFVVNIESFDSEYYIVWNLSYFSSLATLWLYFDLICLMSSKIYWLHSLIYCRQVLILSELPNKFELVQAMPKICFQVMQVRSSEDLWNEVCMMHQLCVSLVCIHSSNGQPRRRKCKMHVTRFCMF